MIPVELYRPIFQLVSPHDLGLLCAVCRFFHDEARPILYCDVDLHNSTKQQLLSWCLTVSESPHLAHMVRSLCIPCTVPSLQNMAQSNHDEYGRNLCKALAQALKSVTHLLALSIKGNMRHHGTFEGYLWLDMFKGCKFRLRVLHDEGYTFLQYEDLMAFLLRQPEIRDWRPGTDAARPRSGLDAQFPPNLLPRMSIAHVHYQPNRDIPLLHMVASRQLVRLSIDMTNALLTKSTLNSIMRIIRESAQSLTHLRFHLERTHRLLHESLGDHDEWIPTDAIGLVAEHLPGLKFLSYIQVPSHKWVS
jgi:hypothetical protein